MTPEHNQKRCTKCGLLKDLRQYHKRPGTDKPRSRCKACRETEKREFRRRRASPKPEPLPADPGMKQCRICGEVLPLERFGRIPSRNGQVLSRCKACSYAVQKHWRATESGKESLKRIGRRSRQPKQLALPFGPVYYWSSPRGRAVRAGVVHRRRARQNKANSGPSKLSSDQWLNLCAKQKNMCAYCNVTCKLTVDHVIPISAGGSHALRNVVGCCKSCNSAKGRLSLMDWLLLKSCPIGV